MRSRKRTWVELGIVALGLLLVCSSAGVGADQPLLAQASPPEQTGEAAEPGQAGRAGEVAELWKSMARLQAEVARLQAEVAQLRALLAGGGPGVGGAGEAGIGDPAAEAEVGATGLGDPMAEGVGGGGRAGTATRDTDDQGTVVANVMVTGRVRSVSARQIVLLAEEGEDDEPLTLPLARDVRVLRDGRSVGLKALQEGMRVQASANLLAPDSPVTEILVLPPKEEGEEE
jgi:hypothetical protein